MWHQKCNTAHRKLTTRDRNIPVWGFVKCLFLLESHSVGSPKSCGLMETRSVEVHAALDKEHEQKKLTIV